MNKIQERVNFPNGDQSGIMHVRPLTRNKVLYFVFEEQDCPEPD
jgi:hypothetical protein